MIIVISAIVLIGFGITLALLCRNDVLSAGWVADLSLGIAVIGIIALFFGGSAYLSKRADIKQDIEDKTIERLGIEQNYKQAMQTSDKHRQMSAIAKIVTWNEEVELYKRRSKNPIIGDFFPDEVAENLQYIDLESEDLCTK